MMRTYIVDSFTDVLFKGNPAGVCMVTDSVSVASMFSIAREFNFSETAFVCRRGPSLYSIRYFSPKMEIPLCGHATLAAAKVIFEEIDEERIEFATIENRRLIVKKNRNLLEMEFPIYETVPAHAPVVLLNALGIDRIENAEYNSETRILLIEILDTDILRSLQPDFEALYNAHESINGVLVTALSNDGKYDFHSRYFWPWSGTNEDPVTGGTHTFLAKYWSVRLGKKTLASFQSSARSGFMEVEITQQNTVLIRGSAIIVLQGEINLLPEFD